MKVTPKTETKVVGVVVELDRGEANALRQISGVYCGSRLTEEFAAQVCNAIDAALKEQ